MAGRSKRRHRAHSLPGPLRCIVALEHRVSDRGTADDSRAQRGIFRLRAGFELAAFPVARSGRQLATLAMKSAMIETESEMAGRARESTSSSVRRESSKAAPASAVAARARLRFFPEIGTSCWRMKL